MRRALALYLRRGGVGERPFHICSGGTGWKKKKGKLPGAKKVFVQGGSIGQGERREGTSQVPMVGVWNEGGSTYHLLKATIMHTKSRQREKVLENHKTDPWGGPSSLFLKGSACLPKNPRGEKKKKNGNEITS